MGKQSRGKSGRLQNWKENGEEREWHRGERLLELGETGAGGEPSPLGRADQGVNQQFSPINE